MVMIELGVGLIPDPLPPIIQVILVNCWYFIVMVMTEVGIGLRPANFLYITIVDYIFPTQVSLKKIFQWLCK